MNHYFFAIIVTCISTFSHSEEVTPPSPTTVKEVQEPTLWDKTKSQGEKVFETGKSEAKKVSDKLDETKINRGQNRHQILANYSFFDTWIPGKWGVSYSYFPNASGGWEIEYLRGTIAVPFIIDDLGKVTDQRLSVFYRSYSRRNSFSFLYGLNYSSFTAYLGNDFLATISGGNAAQYDLITIRTLGFTWGMGNRWFINKKFTMGLDWFTIYIPVATLEADADFLNASADEGKKRDIRDALDIIKHIPTFAILKLQAGLNF